MAQVTGTSTSLTARMLAALGLACLSLGLPVAASAMMEALPEDEMASVSGAGIAIALDDFQFAMAPTSYFEQVGNNPPTTCSGTGTAASNLNCWRRGDLRWYGLNMSGATAGSGPYQWDDTTTCDPSSLNCPRGGVIDQFSPFDNPYIIRAWSPQGMSHNGDCINGVDGAGGCNDAVNTTKAIYEFLAPTARNGANNGPGQPNYSFSFWGEIEAGATRNSATQALATNAGSRLKSQTLIRGNAAGSAFRLFQFTQTTPVDNRTFGMFYHSWLRGDFRFSLAQTAAGAGDAIGVPTLFADSEGLHFRNVEAFVPLGQLYYQALTLGAIGTSGNFYIELTQLPNTAAVYTEFYGLRGGDTAGYETARCNVPGAPACGTTTYNADYATSHGFSRWGGWYPGLASGRNTINDTNDGIFFRACGLCTSFIAFAKRPTRIDVRGETQSMQRTQNYNCNTGNTGGCAVVADGGGPTVAGTGDSTRSYPTTSVSLGDARIEGLLIQGLRFESCAAGGC